MAVTTRVIDTAACVGGMAAPGGVGGGGKGPAMSGHVGGDERERDFLFWQEAKCGRRGWGGARARLGPDAPYAPPSPKVIENYTEVIYRIIACRDIPRHPTTNYWGYLGLCREWTADSLARLVRVALLRPPACNFALAAEETGHYLLFTLLQLKSFQNVWYTARLDRELAVRQGERAYVGEDDHKAGYSGNYCAVIICSAIWATLSVVQFSLVGHDERIGVTCPGETAIYTSICLGERVDSGSGEANVGWSESFGGSTGPSKAISAATVYTNFQGAGPQSRQQFQATVVGVNGGSAQFTTPTSLDPKPAGPRSGMYPGSTKQFMLARN
ncbi:hypothetical protein B0H13DRAFT_1900609 [Mycena leptocephala]|nr:hypothetical protein B0H13DRAFT_1900609 [Mycena leptocephala]